ncbi:Mrp/NBP35 family ATP-binding protein [Clostridium tagluense]|uniref:Mrp/NBP35 family ATP-binding protein n=1 Tax=Clostridium tagluense TaxID=360422 RepID=UPI001C6E6964|nr:Mrp/NBP35 family ATP-binding protein [Clostridium tagluense]MBW9157416.1 Mrp/NBP35 family ATP-binding protein [Clostridium tagluense]WLC66717.1 Mrp/NBP35 family ATP-binding protein [Clostridium tagluense]
MANCKSCPSNAKCDSKDTCSIENNPLNKVKNIIGVMSGKGGVGKSTISALIAHELNKKGYKVGLMDSDITGPSIPRLLGIKDVKPLMNELGIVPVRTTEGIDVISMNFLVENEEDPVIWRGPAVSGVVKQFWTDVIWGELDYLIIDMPPGTGDVALTVMQSIPITGIVMVSTPQDLVSMIVGKAVNMAHKLNIDIIGLIENMSYIICPECNDKIRIFESANIDEFLNKNQLDLLGEIPMCREIVNISNKGEYKLNTELTEIVENIISKIISNIENKK